MIYIILFVLMLSADLISKYFIEKSMELGQSIPVINGVFHITYITNDGAAFSMLSKNQGLLIFATALFMLAVLAYIIVKKPQSRVINIALTMILAGGAGNLYDRILFHCVRDFFDFQLINFAIFNVADIFVVCGSVLLAVYLIFFEEKKGQS